jgi:hypothetical protein
MSQRKVSFLFVLLISAVLPGLSQQVQFEASGYTNHGLWYTRASVSPLYWGPGAPVTVEATLELEDEHVRSLAAAGLRADRVCLLVTAERTFDSDGWLRLASDERMSTLVTPTGLPIEGGVQGAVTNRFGYGFRTPLDWFATQALRRVVLYSRDRPRGSGGFVDPDEPPVISRSAFFHLETKLPDDLPPGIYRVRLDFGIVVGTRYYSLNGDSFAKRPFFQGRPVESHIYSPPIRASGRHVSGRWVDAAAIQPRIPWVLMGSYNSNGYRGVVAEEDKARFGVSGRNLIQDDIILPLYSDSGSKLSYSLEPQFPPDTIEARSNIPWNYTQGAVSIQVTGPDGKTVDLGTRPFVGASGQWPTTKNSSITGWKPPVYGLYTVKASGHTVDSRGNRYEGGGTYRFWVAKRMTLATATFQAYAYPVGNRYGRDIGFAPAVPADVEVTATLYRNSSPNDTKTVKYAGKASPGGIFGSAQGMQPLTFDAPGEYVGYVLARYTDPDGHLWVCSMRHAGVVFPPDSPIIARGKKVTIGGKYVDRGNTQFEGWVDTVTGESHLAHLNFPFQAGDVLLIASEGQGANKIEPVLIYELKQNPKPYDSRLQGIGVTNIQLRTSNGYSPHLFPEYITDWEYYYSGAPRPGFMGRFLVAEDGTRAPYWPTSPNSFGGQINASGNGDSPGDIYRLVGGVVLRDKNVAPAYAGYLASAFLLPKGSRNNRIIAAGSEELEGSDRSKARFFLVSTRPGMLYELGSSFVPVAQIDPVLPALVTFSLDYPDGRRMLAQGTGDATGAFAGPDRWTLDVPGVYKFRLEAGWQGYPGYMPGLPGGGGEFYVIEKSRPPGAAGMRFNLPPESSFTPQQGVTISGTSTARAVRYAAVIPGAVIGQGELPVSGGQFSLRLDPEDINRVTPTYDFTSISTGNPEIKDVIHLTFFSEEVTPQGVVWHDFVRLIIRGNRILYTR